MPENTLSTIGLANRLVCFSAYGYALYFGSHLNLVTPKFKSITGIGQFKYLTIWNLAVHFSFFGLCLLCEMLPYMKRRSPKKMRDLIYHSLVVPLGMFVFIAFWGIYLYNPELMIPENIRPFFPAWYNHVIHTLILPGLLIEGICYYHRLPERKIGCKLLLSVIGAYGMLVLYYGYFRRFWVYPVLEVLPVPGKLVFLLTGGGFILSHYFVGERINRIRWKGRIKQE